MTLDRLPARLIDFYNDYGVLNKFADFIIEKKLVYLDGENNIRVGIPIEEIHLFIGFFNNRNLLDPSLIDDFIEELPINEVVFGLILCGEYSSKERFITQVSRSLTNSICSPNYNNKHSPGKLSPDTFILPYLIQRIDSIPKLNFTVRTNYRSLAIDFARNYCDEIRHDSKLTVAAFDLLATPNYPYYNIDAFIVMAVCFLRERNVDIAHPLEWRYPRHKEKW